MSDTSSKAPRRTWRDWLVLEVLGASERDALHESSLSRLYQHNLAHDCGALTAFRKTDACVDGKLYSKDDNRKRNRSLLAKLQVKSFGVTPIFGRYPEGGTVGKEESFFVVDLHDRGDLEKSLRALGEEFDQDSILFIPKGAIHGDAKARLIGTNHCPNNWIHHGQSVSFDVGRMGHESPIYTSFVKGRPFIFEETGTPFQPPATGFGWWGLQLAAKKHWTKLF